MRYIESVTMHDLKQFIFPSNIYSFVRGDVNGDNIPDSIFLMGNQSLDSPFVQNITLVIQDGITGLTTSILLQFNAGYEPTLFLGDFTGNGVNDILIGFASGGSGGIMYYYIYSYLNSIYRLLFDFNVYNEQFKYLVTYKDNYMVEVFSELNKVRYRLDLSYKGTDYLSEIYNTTGTLTNPIKGFVDPLSGLYPVDFDSNGIYELLAYQKISGRYHADSLGFIQNILKWETNRFTLERQFVAINGES